MSLDQLTNPSPVVTQPCLVGRAAANLPDSYRDAFAKQLATRWVDGGPTDFEVTRAMNRAGIKASPASVNRHRSQKCTCPEENQ
jgi:hypothetical protein